MTNIIKRNIKSFIKDFLLTLTTTEIPATAILLIISLIIGFPKTIIIFGLALTLTANIIAFLIGITITQIKSKKTILNDNSKKISNQNILDKRNIKQEILERIKTIDDLLNKLQEEEKQKYIQKIQIQKDQLLSSLKFEPLNNLTSVQENDESKIIEFNMYLGNIQNELTQKVYDLKTPTKLTTKNKPLTRTRKKKGL